jgi:hypothetical protein
VIPTSQVWGTIISDNIIRGRYDEKKPNEYQSQDYDVIYRNTISKIIYDNFGAEPKHRSDGNAFVFDVKKLAKAGRVYDIETNIQVKLDDNNNDANKGKEKSEGNEGSEGTYTPFDANTSEKTMKSKEENRDISNYSKKSKETLQEIKGSNPSKQPSEPSEHSSTTTGR